MSDTSKPTIERRGLYEAPQVRSDQAGTVLTGYALKFDTPSAPINGERGSTFVETIAPSALARLRERRDVKFAVNHDLSKVYGSTKAGTLTLDVDAIGLRFSLRPPASPSGDDLVESVRRGDLDAMSFGFVVRGEVWQREQRPPVRRLTDVDLFEISAVPFAAYQDAGIVVESRALEEAARIVADDRQRDRWAAVRAVELRLDPTRASAGRAIELRLDPARGATVPVDGRTFREIARDHLETARRIMRKGADQGGRLSDDDHNALADALTYAGLALQLAKVSVPVERGTPDLRRLDVSLRELETRVAALG